MAYETKKSAAIIFLIISLGLYSIITAISAWAMNHGIVRSHETASVLSIPLRIFPIYFPFGNMATGFFVIFSIVAGILGMTTSITGIQNVGQWNVSNLHAAAVSSLITWSLNLLAMGFACKEINIGYTDSNLRTLEVVTILAAATQMISSVAIHAGLEQAIQYERHRLPGPRR